MHWIDVSRTDVGSEWKLCNCILGSIVVTAAKVDHKGEREPSCCDLVHPCVDVFFLRPKLIVLYLKDKYHYNNSL